MHVATDGQIFRRQRFGGISRMFTSIEKYINLQPAHDIDFKIIAPLHYNSYLSNKLNSDFPRRRITRIPNKVRPLIDNVNKEVSIRQLRKFQPKVLHETFYLDDFPEMLIPRVTTIFDMTREIIDENRERLALKRKAVERANHIICISENTKKDFLKYIPCEESKVSVIHLGIDKPSTFSAKSNQPKNNSRPYILYVGDRAGYKNFLVLLEAYAISSDLRKNFRIVAFGGGDPDSHEIANMNRLSLSERDITFISGDDSVLDYAYRHACVFVYTSRYEGFGLPPLEAMIRGCPVVSSNSSSLPEVLGQAPHFFDYSSAEDLRDALCKVLTDGEHREALIKNGLSQADKYKWETVANLHSRIYKELI